MVRLCADCSLHAAAFISANKMKNIFHHSIVTDNFLPVLAALPEFAIVAFIFRYISVFATILPHSV